MGSRASKLLGLSAALAALGAPAIAPTTAAAADVEGSVSTDSGRDPAVIQIAVGEDLMNFIVGVGDGGTIVADHSSHASHASHSSHSSHSSHYSSR